MQQQSFMQSGQQQGVMPQPPQVITVKDQLYITDMLSWNLLACKKAHFFAQQCQDPEVKQALEQAGQMHQRHYTMLLGHLQNQQNMATVQ
ncbi:hypothetical protein P4637_00765 [Halalkalibacterium halodurans]|jgi:hypothetical protein|uniref:BH3489 protein n=2 Tax=Halalkalibacterium halodurans TaxID=86665 RepID=Q9K781_HALH5|nr:hypothetical protein [Halalkalibacterium halodurans]MDY7224015.1 hypothetical protein [Halalkalibacterium halodurans]MDY7243300.1 hypothetical protein [Halalkalibacterium halodurans]MED3646654.1 hypothetical protein [Halalkalibacterium halodurans]MED4080167.1 hypothetical protein [Halalkalibacterium halodurans]MED4083390.1 hypothetical protein [Halalkalibacterium halodurans]